MRYSLCLCCVSAHVYYVVVTLSAPETIEIGTPPAIQLMQIEPA
jgi:hypothetical protein